MRALEKLQTIIILFAVGLGFLLGQVDIIEQYAENFVIPFLFLMLYGLFLTIPLQQLKKAFSNIKFLGSSTIINFIWTPILAWSLGAVFLADYPALWIGFIMLMVTPCTDWYLVFTGIAKGNVSLSTSVLPINLILQVVFLPVYLLLFAGTIETIAVSTLVESILIVLVIPFILAHLTRFLLRRRESVLNNKIIPFFGNAQIFFLALAIMAMFASQGSYLLENLEVIYILIIPILMFFVINYLIGRLVATFLNFSYEDSVSLSMTIVARNSPVALAIAVTAFPDQPLIALALVIGPLIELPVLAIVSQILLLKRRKSKK
ncbi:ACR3 family arsenite efflux pump ArsB [Virgibacillus natechei]|uniref:ACR3 family arsenite efflux pump ArsB n=1 Tax=Virgibacillus natechei TaxID=1216297 RepID=A0ABS4IIH8_9BACI|nr:arsenic resistance protein [Virgibacillus natechei]MBP1970727.1 ACR3 family arsenite efflux pump ArsB [Virgibacillus natechei]UZD12033.1 arsenic resistance protein [Virgibacillus natechei]